MQAPESPVKGTEAIWLHTVEDLMQAMLGAGLQVESYREYPVLAWPFLPGIVSEEPGLWKLPGDRQWLPLTIAITARK
jgi:hypothetical protein